MKKSDGKVSSESSRRNNKGLVSSSVRAISGYLRIVQSGASTVARSAASVASAIIERDAEKEQVLWAGFGKLEGDPIRRVLLLGYLSSFQVWDVEEVDNVRNLVSRNDGPVSFMQILPNPIISKGSEDKFIESRPLLIVCADASFSESGKIKNGQDHGNGNTLPTVVWFYSLRSHSYVHVIKFRSAVYTVRCSPRVMAVSLPSQIHCFDATTLERVYTILTNPIVTSYPGAAGVGYGPLAVGPRWIAYSGSPVVINAGNLSPHQLTASATFPAPSSNGSLVAHYARESSKQLAAGIVTLSDKGYRTLSGYCSELLPDGFNSQQSGSPGWKGHGFANGQTSDADHVGMVIVRDIVGKDVIAQFKAHKSPISALCFDSSGTLLVTASVHGHNINVFRITPVVSRSSSSSGGASYVHLYILQRGFTNAVIQDMCFSNDSNWIVISSSRGTSHVFAINPLGGAVNFPPPNGLIPITSGLGAMTKPAVHWPPSAMSSHQSLCGPGSPLTLSAISRIRNGNHGWTSTVSGAAAAATGKATLLSGAIASSFLNCKGNDLSVDSGTLKANYHLLVFSPSGCMLLYGIKIANGHETVPVVPGLSSNDDLPSDINGRLIVEAIQKWDICEKQYQMEPVDHIDIYGENGKSGDLKMLQDGMKLGNSSASESMYGGRKSNVSAEENHQTYISEAELQTHRSLEPLWANPGVYFQSMIKDNIWMGGENDVGGEIEIENVPTYLIEAKPKNLVPVDPILDGGLAAHLHQMSGQPENGKFSRKSSSGSLNSATDSATETELCKGMEEMGWDDPKTETESKGSVYNNPSPRAPFKTVNNRESSKMLAQLKFVNNNKGLKEENCFENGDDKFD